ncbi:hypothetical protein, partial [Burkholderia ubonensis]|uniref:hypothetical protein n=1 Tax=Burkholderia ubonensis TaxID=101571 RepID=UPI000B2FE5E7
MTHVLLPLDQPEAWPDPLASLLSGLHGLFLDWQIAPGKVNVKDYDRAILAVADAVRPYSITGWHCTRITDVEIAQIVRKRPAKSPLGVNCRQSSGDGSPTMR